jgi:hypothetical protein
LGRDPRRKEKERIDQRERGIWVISQEGKGTLDQRGHWKKEEGGSLERRKGRFSRIKIIKASWTCVLFDDVVFHWGLDQFMMMIDGFWKEIRGETKDQP